MTNFMASVRWGGSAAALAFVLATGLASPAVAQSSTPAPAQAPKTVTDTPASDTGQPGAQTADASGASSSDIIVTARRRKEAAQDVPIALSVVSTASLAQDNDTNLLQAQQLVPALQVFATNPRNSVVTIRGLGANSSVSVDGLENGVGFYVDGVYYARPGQSQFDLVDLQQIEVLRGPQGTLFGKNTTAGALNITTRAPSFTPDLTAEASLGNYEYRQFRFSASAPLIADKLAARIAVGDTEHDGYFTNRYDGSSPQDYHDLSLRGQLLAKPTDDLSIRLIGDYSRVRQRLVLGAVDGYYTTYANGATVANNFLARAARLNYTTLPGDAFDRIVDLNSPFQANMKSYGASGEVNWDLHGVTLTSITAYRWWDWDPKNDIDSTSLAVYTQGQTADRQRQFSQEVRLASDGTHKIDYVVGGYYFWQVVKSYARNAFGADFIPYSFDTTKLPAATVASYTTAFQNFEDDNVANPTTKSYAAFGQLNWHITPRLTLTTGLRFTHETKNGSFSQFWVSGADPATLTPAQLAIRSAFGAGRVAFSAHDTSNAVTGLATLAYKVTPDALVYATYSRGNQSGGLNLTAGGASQPVVKPEEVNNYEVGLKSQWLDHRLTANVAAFWTDVFDYQTAITQYLVVNGQQTTSTTQYIANIPKVRSRGVEADLNLALTHWISLFASGAYTDARYIKYVNAPIAPENSNLSAIQNLSGVRLPNLPKFAYTVGGDVVQPLAGTSNLGDGLDLYLHADYAHRSSYNSTNTNSIYGEVAGYGILNGRIGIRTENGRYDLSLWAKNLANKDYYLSRSGSIGLITAIIGDPRTVGATLRIGL